MDDLTKIRELTETARNISQSIEGFREIHRFLTNGLFLGVEAERLAMCKRMAMSLAEQAQAQLNDIDAQLGKRMQPKTEEAVSVAN